MTTVMNKDDGIVKYLQVKGINLSMTARHEEYVANLQSSYHLWAVTLKGPNGTINDEILSPNDNLSPPPLVSVINEFAIASVLTYTEYDEWVKRFFSCDTSPGKFGTKNRGVRFNKISGLNENEIEGILSSYISKPDTSWKLWGSFDK